MLKPGDEIDVWVVDRALGQGGMGSVYRCHNREAKRILAAVKVLDANLGRQPNAKARFVREAEILFGLDHPGIVKVRNVRMDLATPYLEMEFIDGVNLEARMRQGPMPAAEALPIFQQIADALAYLHARGVRHRDIKPSNVVIQPNGKVKLVDFGIATEADAVTITQQGQTFGSVSYAPPEWLEPSELDPVRWDIYATGVVFWEVLTGAQAFPMSGEGTVKQQVLRAIAVKQRHPPLDPGPRCPRALRALIRDMTQPHWRSRTGDTEDIRVRLVSVDLADVEDPNGERRSTVPTWFPDAPAVAGAAATMVPGDVEPPRAPPAETEPPLDDLPRAPAAPAMAPIGSPSTRASRPGPGAGERAPGANPPPPGLDTTGDPRRTPLLIAVAAVGVAALATALLRLGPPPAPVSSPTPAPVAAPVAAPEPVPAPTPAEATTPPTPEAPSPTPEPVPPPPRPAAPVPAAQPAVPATEARRAPSGRPSVVTNAAFARWLVAHPDWAPDAARGSGKADGNYLSGWVGAAPPEGQESRAVVNVPWGAADAYCAGRGGLPGVDDAPLTWTESPNQPWHEHRQADGRPAWRRSDGTTSTAVKRAEALPYIGFRCAR